MLNFVLQRIARVVFILVSVELVVFLLIHAIPGSPWDTPANQRKAMRNVFVDDKTLERRNKYYGLDLPLWRQFTRYLIGDVHEDGVFICGVVCGNLGLSTRQAGRSVQDVLFRPPKGKTFEESRIGYTARLVSYSFIIISVLGVPLGVASAFRVKSRFDKALSNFFTTVVSIPIFVLGLLGIVIFASTLKWINVLPNWSEPKYWILPVVLLALIPLANIVRLTRAAVLNAMGEDYIRTARAKGLSHSQAMWKHVLPNALVTVTAFLMPIFMELLAASFIIEGIFGFPGFGREYWDAIGNHDYSMIMGITFIYALGITLINLFLDTLYGVIDPRMRSR